MTMKATQRCRFYEDVELAQPFPESVGSCHFLTGIRDAMALSFISARLTIGTLNGGREIEGGERASPVIMGVKYLPAVAVLTACAAFVIKEERSRCWFWC